jgi:putative flippase GtrA
MSMYRSEPWHHKPLFRFLLVGGTNTLITSAIVVVLSFVMPGTVAFTIAFALGILYSLILTGRWVFKSQLTASRSATYVGAYAVIYLCGLAFVWAVGTAGGPPWANGFSVFLTAPLSFVAGRFIFPRSQPSQVDTA